MKLLRAALSLLVLFTFSWALSAPLIATPGEVHDDKSVISAINSRRNAYYVQAGNLVVSKILPTDTKGLPHEKWMATLSDGSSVMIVYNLEMGEEVRLKVGDVFSVGGQFIWTKKGGLIHWTHDDPRKTRPDGYVYFNGVVYGDTNGDSRK